MALQTLDSKTKAAFTAAGVTLTPAQEHCCATATTIDWQALLTTLGNIAKVVIPIIISIFGGQTPPTPTPAPAKGATCCDHHACCLKTFEACMAAAKLAGEHLCQCCCE